MEKWYSIECKKFCCAICVKDAIIIKTAPILHRFEDQKLVNLFNWLDDKFEGYKIHELKEIKNVEITQ